MKRFQGFLIKEFYHIFRDFRTILILFGMPVAQVLLFGYVITNEVKDAKIAFLDYSGDEVTMEIKNKILSSGYFIETAQISSGNQIEETFKGGIVKLVVVFEPRFASRLEREKKANIQLIADASDANIASLLTQFTSAIIMDYMKDYNHSASIPIHIQPQIRMEYNKELKGVFMFIPGIMAMILMLVSAMMTSITITREKEMNTMEALLVSPLRPFQIIVGKVTPYMALSFVNACTILLLARFVFKMPIQGNLILLMAECMLFILLALSVGIFISTVANSQQTAMFMSMVGLMLPTILLSGFIFPIESMPVLLQWISNLMPPKWFIIIIKNIMLKGTGLFYVWKETFILIAMTLFFLLLSIKKFKVRLE